LLRRRLELLFETTEPSPSVVPLAVEDTASIFETDEVTSLRLLGRALRPFADLLLLRPVMLALLLLRIFCTLFSASWLVDLPRARLLLEDL
jgi:hypothetical protein